jgi:hypothetical protein
MGHTDLFEGVNLKIFYNIIPINKKKADQRSAFPSRCIKRLFLNKGNYKGYDIECYKSSGPSFGLGELRSKEPFN